MIKSLEIKNFKSFLNETIDQFSSNLNLVIGKNGHGKSNFYSALKFVFNVDSRDKILPEEKRILLNEKLVEDSLHV